MGVGRVPAVPDDVQLTDLEVIARYSLAVRAASAPREEVVAALEADLAWLTGEVRRRAPRRAPARKAVNRGAGEA